MGKSSQKQELKKKNKWWNWKCYHPFGSQHHKSAENHIAIHINYCGMNAKLNTFKSFCVSHQHYMKICFVRFNRKNSSFFVSINEYSVSNPFKRILFVKSFSQFEMSKTIKCFLFLIWFSFVGSWSNYCLS